DVWPYDLTAGLSIAGIELTMIPRVPPCHLPLHHLPSPQTPKRPKSRLGTPDHETPSHARRCLRMNQLRQGTARVAVESTRDEMKGGRCRFPVLMCAGGQPRFVYSIVRTT
ncbi:hypothetical protein BDN71DRAFT_1454326, partial [Pleurotus eryngii]